MNRLVLVLVLEDKPLNRERGRGRRRDQNTGSGKEAVFEACDASTARLDESHRAKSNFLMRAMVFSEPGRLLDESDLSIPEPQRGQLLVRVRACGVCRTDLHVLDGDLVRPKLPLVPGHEIVGEVVQHGEGAERFAAGTRVGIPWLGWTCGECSFCRAGRENLCAQARFTGYTLDGGYADYVSADERFAFPYLIIIPTLRRRRCSAPD